MSRRSRGGFTLPEVLLSSIITVFIFTATIISYMSFSKLWKEDDATAGLARGVFIAIEKMERGLGGNNGVREAKLIMTPQEGLSSDMVEYKDLSDQIRKFYYSGNRIYSEASATNPILSDVESVTFSNTNKMIRIDLLSAKNLGYKTVKLRVVTDVKHRN